MEIPNANDYNAGNPGDGSQGNAGSGNQGNDPSSQGQPGNQGGQQPGQGADELARMKAEVQRLNKALVDAKRQGNQSQNRNAGQGQDDYDPFNDPAGQYQIAMKVATGDLRGKLEDTLALYPELPADVVNQIRRNPWAYANQDSFFSLNVDNALLDIETQVANYVASLGDQNNGQGQANNGAANNNTPASVNPNSATEPEGDAQPQNDWDLPMDQLEAKANKVKQDMLKKR